MTNKARQPKRPYYPVDPWNDMRAPRHQQYGTPAGPEVLNEEEDDLSIVEIPVNPSVLPKHVRGLNNKNKYRRRQVAAISAIVGGVIIGALIASHESKADAEISQEALNELNNQVPVEQTVPAPAEKDAFTQIEIKDTSSPAEQVPVEQSEKAPAINIELPPATASTIEHRMPLIEELKPLYVEAAKEVGLPWQAAAALHYREADNGEDRSMLSGELLGTVNPDSHKVAPTDQLENYTKALQHLKEMAKAVYGIELTDKSSLEDFAKAATAFNRGYKYKRADMTYLDLPYAMAGLEGFEDMSWPTKGGSYPDGNTYGETSSLAGKTESRPGFVAIMAALGYTVSDQAVASR